MNIVIDARLYGVENTGIGRYSIGLLRSLKKIDSKNHYHILLRKMYFNQLNLPGNFKKVLVDIPHYSIQEQTKLPSIIASLNPDLVHFLHFNVPVTYKKPYVVTIHDLLMHKQKGTKATTLPAPMYFAKRLGYKFVFGSAIKNSKRIIAPSEAVKQEIMDYYKTSKAKIPVIYEGVDAISPDKADERVLAKHNLKDGEYFIYVGNAYPHKNLSRAIEAVGLLNKNNNLQIKLAIVCARNVFSDRLEKEIKRLNASDYTKFLGFIPDSELGFLYKHSLAFLYPSLSEGFGLPGLEAILSGSIACVSDIPVFREVYKDYAIYFDPYDISAIENTLEWVLKMNPESKATFISNCQEFAKGYSWDKMAEETLKVYEDCARLR